MSVTKSELLELLREKLSVEVSIDTESYGWDGVGRRVTVTLYLDGEKISYDSDTV